MFRIGFGQDSHCFSNNLEKKLILGGVEFPSGNKPLEGNSDADVVIHALCNALEQAIGKDSLSVYSDKMCKNGITDSREYLKVAAGHILKNGYFINNIGITIEAKFPKILSMSGKIRESLASCLKIRKEQIGLMLQAEKK